MDFANERISCIDALQFDQGLLAAIHCSRHRAKRRRLTDAAARVEPSAIRLTGAQMRARDREGSSKDHLTLAGEASGQGIRQGANRRYHHDAQRQTRDENIKP